MTKYSAGTMTAHVSAAPNINSDDVLAASKGDPSSLRRMGGLENPWFEITVLWNWPIENFWSEFLLIRTVRSPAVRVEEGFAVAGGTLENWTQYSSISGQPFFVDQGPPPGEWVYYTLFCMDENRVWSPAGSAFEIGPYDYGWTLRLPEMLPGVAVSAERGIMSVADQSHDVVQFLQIPAAALDQTVTMAETAQYFWDPESCPPHNLKHIASSWGYGYDESIGAGRARHVLAALRGPVQGSLSAIRSIVEAAAGTSATVEISNNLFLDINDSSFESGSVWDTGWEPVYTTPGDEGTRLEVRPLAGIPGVILPPNARSDYFLYIPTARTIKCGSYTVRNQFGEPVVIDGVPSRAFDPLLRGIPISSWSKVRMGCYALNKLPNSTPSPPVPAATISMSMDIYDSDGVLIQTLSVLEARTLSWDWSWYGNGDGRVGTPESPTDTSVEIPTAAIDLVPSDYLDNAFAWITADVPYMGPQPAGTVLPPEEGGIKFTWNVNPTVGSNDMAARLLHCHGSTSGASYGISVRAITPVDENGDPLPAAAWRAVVNDGSLYYRGPIVPGDGTAATSSLTVQAAGESLKVGIEVLKPDAGWSAAGSHIITEVIAVRGNRAHAYGVPTLTVVDACSVDLIVVDDG